MFHRNNPLPRMFFPPRSAVFAVPPPLPVNPRSVCKVRGPPCSPLHSSFSRGAGYSLAFERPQNEKKSASFALFPSAGDNSRLTVSFQNWNRTMRRKNENSFFHQFFSFLEVFRPEKSHASLFLLSSPGYKGGRRPWRTGRGSRS